MLAARSLAVLAATAVLMVLALPAPAQTLAEAFAAYQRGDHAAAARGFRMYAERGDASAQFMLGNMYHLGRGVAQD